MSTEARLAQAREDLSAARAARADFEDRRVEARAMEAEQEQPQNRMQYALRAVSLRMQVDTMDKEIARLMAEIATINAAPVVLTPDQLLAVDDTAGLLP